jgi:hypothetical protein
MLHLHMLNSVKISARLFIGFSLNIPGFGLVSTRFCPFKTRWWKSTPTPEEESSVMILSFIYFFLEYLLAILLQILQYCIYLWFVLRYFQHNHTMLISSHNDTRYHSSEVELTGRFPCYAMTNYNVDPRVLRSHSHTMSIMDEWVLFNI